MYENISKKIQESNKIMIFGHDKMDGDCVGACISMKKWILRQYPNKKINICTPSEVSSSFSFIVGNEKIIYGNDIIIKEGEYDIAIILDCGAIDRIGITYENNKKVLDNIFKINIDHHFSNIGFGDINVVESNRPSSCQIIYKIMKEINKKSISPRIATALLMGIMMDTQNFKIQTTDKDSFEASAELIELGARRKDIYEKLFNNKKYNDIKYIGLLLSRIKQGKYEDITYYYTFSHTDEIEKHGVDIGNPEGYKRDLINTINKIGDGQFVITFTIDKKENHTKLSFRSRRYDVNKLAGTIGGGGHKGAAGAKLNYAIDPENIEESIEEMIKKS